MCDVGSSAPDSNLNENLIGMDKHNVERVTFKLNPKQTVRLIIKMIIPE